jgi:prolipoprotein diacylglyceryltransferase
MPDFWQWYGLFFCAVGAIELYLMLKKDYAEGHKLTHIIASFVVFVMMYLLVGLRLMGWL